VLSEAIIGATPGSLERGRQVVVLDAELSAERLDAALIGPMRLALVEFALGRNREDHQRASSPFRLFPDLRQERRRHPEIEIKAVRHAPLRLPGLARLRDLFDPELHVSIQMGPQQPLAERALLRRTARLGFRLGVPFRDLGHRDAGERLKSSKSSLLSRSRETKSSSNSTS